MYRLDGVDEEVKSYFAPVAKLVLASRDPQEAMVVSGSLLAPRRHPWPLPAPTHTLAAWVVLQRCRRPPLADRTRWH